MRAGAAGSWSVPFSVISQEEAAYVYPNEHVSNCCPRLPDPGFVRAWCARRKGNGHVTVAPTVTATVTVAGDAGDKHASVIRNPL